MYYVVYCLRVPGEASKGTTVPQPEEPGWARRAMRTSLEGSVPVGCSSEPTADGKLLLGHGQSCQFLWLFQPQLVPSQLWVPQSIKMYTCLGSGKSSSNQMELRYIILCQFVFWIQSEHEWCWSAQCRHRWVMPHENVTVDKRAQQTPYLSRTEVD